MVKKNLNDINLNDKHILAKDDNSDAECVDCEVVDVEPDNFDLDDNSDKNNYQLTDYNSNNFLPADSSKSDISHYLKEISKYPILSEEEELKLALSYYNDNDLNAAHTLVTSHLRMVVKVAFDYRGYGLPIADMISEGSVGLMKAVKKFDPNKGYRFSTYALWWVKAQINELVLNNWSMVKIGTSAAQKKLFFNLKKTKERLNIMSNGALSDEEADLISESLGVEPKDVIDMNARLAYSSDLSLNSSIKNHSGNSDDASVERGDMLPSKDLNAEDLLIKVDLENYHKKLILEAMEKLNDREKEIIISRKLSDKPMLLDELGAKFGVSKERIRQIEESALLKMQKYLTSKNIKI